MCRSPDKYGARNPVLSACLFTALCDRLLLFVYFQVNNGVLYCFWVMKILIIMVLYRLLRRTHHRLFLRVIGYRRERGTYRQLSYAQALKKTGCQSVEATIRQRRLLFAGAMARQPAGRLPKRLMDEKLVGGEDPGTPRAKLDGLSQGRLPSVRSHRRLYGGQPAHIRS